MTQISFDIEQGEIFGLLGPNGAGKTTTLAMLSTMLEPTSGTAEIMGIDIRKDQDGVRKAIGIVFQDQSLDEELTAWENMDFHGRLYRIPKETREQRIDELLKLVELSDRKNDIVKTFSGGMRRRLEIARGLLHHPHVLFLDEPTLGLDPQTRNHLWQYIETLAKEKNITIILTTHYMEEADRLCNRIAIIDHGKIIALDTPARLKDSIGGDVVTIQSPETEKIAAALAAPWINRIETPRRRGDHQPEKCRAAPQHDRDTLERRENSHHVHLGPQADARRCLPLVYRKDHPGAGHGQKGCDADAFQNDEALTMDIIYTIWLRSMKRYVRSKSRIVGSIAMPLFLLLFLGFGLNSVVSTSVARAGVRPVPGTGHGRDERALYLGLFRHPDHLGQAVRVFKRDACRTGNTA